MISDFARFCTNIEHRVFSPEFDPASNTVQADPVIDEHGHSWPVGALI